MTHNYESQILHNDDSFRIPLRFSHKILKTSRQSQPPNDLIFKIWIRMSEIEIENFDFSKIFDAATVEVKKEYVDVKLILGIFF